MKFLIVLFILLNIKPSWTSDICEDISFPCYKSSRGYMSDIEGKKYCSNVASNCFNLNLKLGFYEAREKCLNVSSTCFADVVVKSGPTVAALACSNVSTVCYTKERNRLRSVNESINRCADVYIPCRTCFKN